MRRWRRDGDSRFREPGRASDVQMQRTAERGKNLCELVQAHCARVGFDLGNARLLDADQRAELSLRQSMAFAQGPKVLLQLVGEADGVAH